MKLARTTANGRDQNSNGRTQPKLSVWVLSVYLAILAFAPGCAGTACPSSTQQDNVSISPGSVTLEPGQSTTFQLTGAGTPRAIPLNFTAGTFPCNPTSANDTIPFTRNVTVTVPTGTPAGTYFFRATIPGATSHLVQSVITVTEPGNTESTFTMTASRDSVTTVSTKFSAPVTFTLTSVNGFEGEVTVDWEESEGLFTDPNFPKPITLNVSPTTPGTFNKRFYRAVDHEDPLTATFTATSGAITRSVSIEVRHGAPQN